MHDTQMICDDHIPLNHHDVVTRTYAEQIISAFREQMEEAGRLAEELHVCWRVAKMRQTGWKRWFAGPKTIASDYRWRAKFPVMATHGCGDSNQRLNPESGKYLNRSMVLKNLWAESA